MQLAFKPKYINNIKTYDHDDLMTAQSKSEYILCAEMLATLFLDMLEQKVQNVLAMKFVTDQESSR